MTAAEEIVKEITKESYWVHFRREKELAFIYPIDHPKRIEIRKAINEMQEELDIK